jgi:hypothetical protein
LNESKQVKSELVELEKKATAELEKNGKISYETSVEIGKM